MRISFDPAKRERTLAERGLDFADAAQLFDGPMVTAIDDRIDYREPRFVTYGWLNGEAVAMAWTVRDGSCRVISMRRMHGKEVIRVGLDRP